MERSYREGREAIAKKREDIGHSERIIRQQGVIGIWGTARFRL